MTYGERTGLVEKKRGRGNGRLLGATYGCGIPLKVLSV